MDWSCSLMQAGRPYPDRLFYLGQFNRAIAGCSHFHQLYWAQRFEPRATRSN
ncbi:hypothetical protein MC7420_802 [Coleofasciculus chthonoplastes PCC 7420]|uniref:Uncharacterized protein n=1 Tax=Coleofasciculus chthonoplastes PCC 7420 TaxID=118168 RepID=B4VTD7_9CYAN|nr:hypothetical protein MC7420_802 [Coleofasciculus chthonoplastes PCC 7420]